MTNRDATQNPVATTSLVAAAPHPRRRHEGDGGWGALRQYGHGSDTHRAQPESFELTLNGLQTPETNNNLGRWCSTDPANRRLLIQNKPDRTLQGSRAYGPASETCYFVMCFFYQCYVLHIYLHFKLNKVFNFVKFADHFKSFVFCFGKQSGISRSLFFES